MLRDALDAHRLVQLEAVRTAFLSKFFGVGCHRVEQDLTILEQEDLEGLVLLKEPALPLLDEAVLDHLGFELVLDLKDYALLAYLIWRLLIKCHCALRIQSAVLVHQEVICFWSLEGHKEGGAWTLHLFVFELFEIYSGKETMSFYCVSILDTNSF